MRSVLAQLQRRMARSVMRPLAPGEKMQARDEKGRSLRAEAAVFIKPNDRLTSFERLEIYNRQYWFRLIGCFYDDFPGLRAVLGEKKFEKMTLAYLEENPSRSFTLRDLGRNLVPWLRRRTQWTRPHEKLAHDMARLEWAHIEAFDLGSEPRLTADDLLDHGGARMRLRLQPHVQLLQLDYPVDDLRLEAQNGGAGNRVSSNAVAMRQHRTRRRTLGKIKARPIFLAVHRSDFSVYYKRLDREAFALLRALQSGQSIGRAIEAAFRGSRIALAKRPGLVQKWFQNWSGLGWFCRPAKK